MNSPELRDLRAKIDPVTDDFLQAYAAARRIPVAHAVRKILHEWAVEQIAISDLLSKRLRAEGLSK